MAKEKAIWLARDWGKVKGLWLYTEEPKKDEVEKMWVASGRIGGWVIENSMKDTGFSRGAGFDIEPGQCIKFTGKSCLF